MSEPQSYAGGCQCGAVRYIIRGELLDPHICHCRMCQKAFGSFFAPLVGFERDQIEWTHGTPAIYRSSTIAERGFCRDCGTPLTLGDLGSPKLSVSIGSLDKPERVKPGRQCGMERRMPWFGELADLPGSRTEDDTPAEILAELKTNQHPDHE